METRSKVAAAAASVVPFHCVICFDEFNLKDRTPMVLPCGHTYVCCQCTRRLKRCMECREPLFVSGTALTAKSCAAGLGTGGGFGLGCHNSAFSAAGGSVSGARISSTGSVYGRSAYGSTSSYHSQSTTPSAAASHPPVMTSSTLHLPPSSQQLANMIPLPIPKNLVLMSMMEAAQRQAMEDSQSLVKGGSAASSSSSSSDDDDDDDEEFNLDRIISGMATLSGPCGTYSVAVDTGLAVLPSDPRKQPKNDDDVATKEEEDDDEQRREDEVIMIVESGEMLPKEEKKEEEAGASTVQTEVEVVTSKKHVAEDEEKKKLNSDDVPAIRKTSTATTEEDGEAASEEEESEGASADSVEAVTGARSGAEPIILRKGQSVQVVDFQDGVAKLARGEGYIVATTSQLVKGESLLCPSSSLYAYMIGAFWS